MRTDHEMPEITDNPDEMLARAIAMKDAGDPSGAVRLLNEAHKIAPRHTGVLHQIGLMFLSVRHFEQAVSCFEKLTHIDRSHAPYWVDLGAVLVQAGRAGEAIDVLQKSIQLDSKNAYALYYLGEAYRQQKNTSMARYAFREAIKNDPQLGLAYYALGVTYFEAGSMQQAIDQYRKAIQASPELKVARDALEAAQQQAAHMKSREQFGRLVDVNSLTTKAGAEVDEQQAASLVSHYDTVKAILKSVEATSLKLSTDITETLCPLIRETGRKLTGSEDAANMTYLQREFRSELKDYATTQKALQTQLARFAALSELTHSNRAMG